MASYEFRDATSAPPVRAGADLPDSIVAPRPGASPRPVGAVCALLTLQLAATLAARRPAADLFADLATPGTVGFEAILIAAAGGAAWICLTWLTMGSVLLALAALPAWVGATCARIAQRTVPPVLRRAAGALLGATVLGVPTLCALPAAAATGPSQISAALAAPVTPSLDGHPTGTAAVDPTPLPDLDRPAPLRPAHKPASRSKQPVVVRSGDSLWSITARWLGPGASDAAVAARWRSWYATNRTVVGPDPDVLRPGQVLSPPPGSRVAYPRPSAEENP